MTVSIDKVVRRMFIVASANDATRFFMENHLSEYSKKGLKIITGSGAGLGSRYELE